MLQGFDVHFTTKNVLRNIVENEILNDVSHNLPSCFFFKEIEPSTLVCTTNFKIQLIIFRNE